MTAFTQSKVFQDYINKHTKSEDNLYQGYNDDYDGMLYIHYVNSEGEANHIHTDWKSLFFSITI